MPETSFEIHMLWNLYRVTIETILLLCFMERVMLCWIVDVGMKSLVWRHNL